MLSVCASCPESRVGDDAAGDRFLELLQVLDGLSVEFEMRCGVVFSHFSCSISGDSSGQSHSTEGILEVHGVLVAADAVAHLDWPADGQLDQPLSSRHHLVVGRHDVAERHVVERRRVEVLLRSRPVAVR